MGWIDLIGITLLMNFWCSVPKKSCICALISRIPLSDAGMDDLGGKSSHLGIGLIFIELIHSKYHFDKPLVMF